MAILGAHYVQHVCRNLIKGNIYPACVSDSALLYNFDLSLWNQHIAEIQISRDELFSKFLKIQRANILTLLASNPNMSRMPMKPSVACLTAEFKTVIDLDAFTPPDPMVEACWLLFSRWWKWKKNQGLMETIWHKVTLSYSKNQKLNALRVLWAYWRICKGSSAWFQGTSRHYMTKQNYNVLSAHFIIFGRSKVKER